MEKSKENIRKLEKKSRRIRKKFWEKSKKILGGKEKIFLKNRKKCVLKK